MRLDVRGKFCPIPVLETAKAIHQVPVGEVLEVLATDPAAEPDLRAWAQNAGHQFLSAERLPDGALRILIRRAR